MDAVAGGRARARRYLAIDDTGFPKHGTDSVGVPRQYCGALGKVGICQVAVPRAPITDDRTWPLAFNLNLHRSWTDDSDRRGLVGLPNTVILREKWKIALAQVRAILKAGFTITGVVVDADYGRNAASCEGLERLGLAYGVAIRGDLVFTLVDVDGGPLSAADVAAAAPTDAWQTVSLGRGSGAAHRGPVLGAPRPAGRGPRGSLVAARTLTGRCLQVLTCCTYRRPRRSTTWSHSRAVAGRSSSSIANSRVTSASTASKVAPIGAGCTTSCSRPWPSPSSRSNAVGMILTCRDPRRPLCGAGSARSLGCSTSSTTDDYSACSTASAATPRSEGDKVSLVHSLGVAAASRRMMRSVWPRHGKGTTVPPSTTEEASVDHLTVVAPAADVATTTPVSADSTSTLVLSSEPVMTAMNLPSSDHWGRAYEATAGSGDTRPKRESDAKPLTIVPWSSGIAKTQTAVGDTATKRSTLGEIAGSQRLSGLLASSSTSRLRSQMRVRRGTTLPRGAAPVDVQ